MTRSSAIIVLAEMYEAASRAASYVEGMSKADFLQDTRTQEAIAMNLINIGEGASRILRLHSDVAASYPQILWQEMIGMRNRIAHGYNDIDMDVVWDTANGTLLDFIAAVEPDVTRFIAEFDARTSNSSNGDS
jgi:uncharacterized protein with HEPN domain